MMAERRCFNSRTLGRVRHRRAYSRTSPRSFNSRTLGRVRRSVGETTGPPLSFQFTHPGKGATLGEMPKQEAMTTFQFTHPGKGATRRVKLLRRRLKVSIHAPWEGCDIALRPSTTQYPVSIHAPWEGCDNSSCNSRLSLHQFQFTHPGKGATVVLPISL